MLTSAKTLTAKTFTAKTSAATSQNQSSKLNIKHKASDKLQEVKNVLAILTTFSLIITSEKSK